MSRVLNNASVVREATRARVLRAVEELRYYPNAHAQALAGGRSRTIGMVMSNLQNPFFQDLFRELDSHAREHGFEVVTANTDYDPERLDSAVRNMIGRRVAGLALTVSEVHETMLDELSERNLPVVAFDVARPRRHLSNIVTNYKRGMQRITEYLYSLGHRRMAFAGHHPALGPLSDREQAFVEVMQHYEGEVEYTTVADADGFAGGRRAAEGLIASGFKPTAILCVNDFMAVGVMRSLREMGLRVPEDVSVTGFDNILLAEYVSPSLTTVHISRDIIGRHIFECLTSEMPVHLAVEPDLVVRESTGPVIKK